MRSAGGDDRIFVGSGYNKIAAGPGKAVFILEYGGVTEFENWGEDYVLDLKKWPKSPHISTINETYTDVTLGVSVVRIYGETREKQLRSQIKQ